MNTTGIFCISADQELNKELNTMLKEIGFGKIQFFPDIISPMNALQISVPSLVILNAEDFPRHWKIFFQLLTSDTQMILYTQGKLEDKEINKTKALGVKVIHTLSKDLFEEYSTPSDIKIPESFPLSNKNLIQKNVINNYGHVVISDDEHLFVFENVKIDELGVHIKQKFTVPGIYNAFIYHDSNNEVENTHLSCVKHYENRLFYLNTGKIEMEA